MRPLRATDALASPGCLLDTAQAYSAEGGTDRGDGGAAEVVTQQPAQRAVVVDRHALIPRIIVLLDRAARNFVVVAHVGAGHAARGPFHAVVVAIVDEAGGGGATDADQPVFGVVVEGVAAAREHVAVVVVGVARPTGCGDRMFVAGVVGVAGALRAIE